MEKRGQNRGSQIFANAEGFAGDFVVGVVGRISVDWEIGGDC